MDHSPASLGRPIPRRGVRSRSARSRRVEPQPQQFRLRTRGCVGVPLQTSGADVQLRQPTPHCTSSNTDGPTADGSSGRPAVSHPCRAASRYGTNPTSSRQRAVTEAGPLFTRERNHDLLEAHSTAPTTVPSSPSFSRGMELACLETLLHDLRRETLRRRTGHGHAREPCTPEPLARPGRPTTKVGDGHRQPTSAPSTKSGHRRRSRDPLAARPTAPPTPASRPRDLATSQDQQGHTSCISGEDASRPANDGVRAAVGKAQRLAARPLGRGSVNGCLPAAVQSGQLTLDRGVGTHIGVP